MKSYKLLYSETWKQVVTLIVLPLLLFFPLIAILVNVQNLSNEMVFALIFGMMAIAIFATIYIFTKHVNVLTSIIITPNGIDISTNKKTWFHRFEHLFIPYSNIASVTDDEDVQHNNRKFYTIKMKHPSKQIVLTAPKKQAPIEMQNFSFELHTEISSFNNSSNALGKTMIKNGSFYTGGFARVLTILIVILMIVLPIAKIAEPDKLEWYKLLWFYALSVAWLGNFFAARKRERKKLKVN